MDNEPNENIPCATARDIQSAADSFSYLSTDLIEATLTLTEKEALLCAFYDNAPLLMGVVEPCEDARDVRFLSVNRTVARMIGRSPLTFRNQSARDIKLPLALVDAFVDACEKAGRNRQPVRFSLAYPRGASGATRHLEITVSPMNSGPSKGTRFLFVGEDVTLRYEAERKMRLLQSAVENAHDAFLILQAPPHALGLPLTPSAELPRVLYANPAFRKMTGYASYEVVGQPVDFLIPRECEGGKTSFNLCAALADNQSVQKEIRLPCKGGKTVWVEMSVQTAAPVGPEGEKHWIVVLRDISAREQAEAQIRLRDRAMEAISSGVIIADAQQNGHPIVYVNPAFEKMTGYKASEALGKHPSELLGDLNTDQATLHVLRDAIANGRATNITLQYKHKNGSPIWRELYLSPVRDDQTGAVTHFVGVNNDVTEKKKAEEVLLLRERAIANASNGIVICDARLPDMPIVYCNPAFETMTGYTSSEVTGRNCRFLQGPDIDEIVRGKMRDAIYHARPCLMTVKNYRKNGDAFWNELNISPVRDAQNRLTHFIGVLNEVTERVAAQAALSEAEARLRHVLQNLPLMAFALDAGGVFTFFDGKGMEILGLESDHIVGRTYQEVFPHDAPFLAFVADALKGEAKTFTQNVGSLVFETTCNPLRDLHTGHVASVIGFSLDVTQRSQLEAQILQNDKLVALGQLAAGVAHEINNPLAAISGHAQLLALHPDEEVRADAQAIKSMTDRAVAVVRSMLAFARPSKGVDKERCLTTLRALTEDTLHLMHFALRTSDINVHLDFAANEPPIFVNSNQIQQIILNLVTNAEYALRSAPEGSDRHIIILTEVEEGGYVSLSVSDNGCGIPIDLQKRIFDPFFTTKDVGEGTGLGLSICHGIASAHKGSLHVESSEGIGTAFTLRLPIADKTMGLTTSTHCTEKI